jgi:YaaC-like Protein
VIRAYTVNRTPPIAGLHAIRTADKYRKIWEYLGRFRSVQYCTGYLNTLIPAASANFALIGRKSAQIASAVTQAEEYFNSARNASWEIKPLLAYYGMVGLAKCLIVAGDNPYTLESTNPRSSEQASHGLSWRPRTPHDSTDRDGPGLLSEFCYVSSRPTVPGLYTLMRRCYALNDVPSRSRFTVKELVSLVPDLQKEFYIHFQEPPGTWQCRSQFGKNTAADSYHVIEFNDYDAHLFGVGGLAAPIIQQFPELAALYHHEGGRSYSSLALCQSADDHIYVGNSVSGGQFAYMRLNGFVLTNADVDFLLLFILSNLVRYRQDKWSDLVNRNENDEIFLVDSAVELAMISFPLFILNEIEGREYRFLGEFSTWG